MSIAADPEEFSQASAWMADVGRANGMPTEEISRLDICMNEALSNVLAHGESPGTRSTVDIRFELQHQGALATAVLTVIDVCKPFNPLSHVTRPPPSRIEEAEPGGLGIAMMRVYADEIRHQFLDGRNELGFTVRWQSPDQTS
jgi:serine/threonine-protein kinase RsbW